MSTVLEVLIYRILATVVPAFEVIQPILDSFGQMPNHTLEELWILVKSLWLCPDIKSVFFVIEGIDMYEDKMTDQLEALGALAHARSLSCKVLATSQTLNDATSGKATVINLNPLILQRQSLEDIIRLTMQNLGAQARGFAELEQLIVKALPGSATPSEIKIRLQVMLRHLPLDLEGDLTRALGPLIDFRNGQPMFANEYVRDYIHNELTAKLNSGGDYSCEVSTHADLTRSRPHIFGTLWGSSSGPTRKMPYFLGTERIGFQPVRSTILALPLPRSRQQKRTYQ
ncbi:hypothetical protein RIB2604_01004840 [Aspergillus luchuensis]|uniref:Uncharacterized protein n=1 Tax=Aspergillus kawachii TaxID=1069201 RepID=A0A146F7D1_ASPKA|nr:hypothetical protein RIB2604_01004840 [Aspergillus luchuensis]